MVIVKLFIQNWRGNLVLICFYNSIVYLNKLVLDWSQKIKSGLYLSLGVGGLNIGGDHGYKPSLAGHLVGVGYHRHVDVRLTTNLENHKESID